MNLNISGSHEIKVLLDVLKSSRLSELNMGEQTELLLKRKLKKTASEGSFVLSVMNRIIIDINEIGITRLGIRRGGHSSWADIQHSCNP